eukprot:5176147-Prymnesium_polylepis.1
MESQDMESTDVVCNYWRDTFRIPPPSAAKVGQDLVEYGARVRASLKCVPLSKVRAPPDLALPTPSPSHRTTFVLPTIDTLCASQITQIINAADLKAGDVEMFRIAVFGPGAGTFPVAPPSTTAGTAAIADAAKTHGGKRLSTAQELKPQRTTKDVCARYSLPPGFYNGSKTLEKIDERKVCIRALFEMRDWAGDLFRDDDELQAIADAITRTFGQLSPHNKAPRTWAAYLKIAMHKARSAPQDYGDVPTNCAAVGSPPPFRGDSGGGEEQPPEQHLPSEPAAVGADKPAEDVPPPGTVPPPPLPAAAA